MPGAGQRVNGAILDRVPGVQTTEHSPRVFYGSFERLTERESTNPIQPCRSEDRETRSVRQDQHWQVVVFEKFNCFIHPALAAIIKCPAAGRVVRQKRSTTRSRACHWRGLRRSAKGKHERCVLGPDAISIGGS